MILAHPLDTVETKRQILAHDKMRVQKCNAGLIVLKV